MTYYLVMTGHGDLICDGVSEHEIERVAQECADRIAETVYYSESGHTDDSDDFNDSDGEDNVIAVEPRTVRCECGQYTGERCQWIGSPDDTVVLEFMPEHLRASHSAARNVGRYPHNGAVRVRCERSCAQSIVADDPDWARIVE